MSTFCGVSLGSRNKPFVKQRVGLQERKIVSTRRCLFYWSRTLFVEVPKKFKFLNFQFVRQKMGFDGENELILKRTECASGQEDRLQEPSSPRRPWGRKGPSIVLRGRVSRSEVLRVVSTKKNQTYSIQSPLSPYLRPLVFLLKGRQTNGKSSGGGSLSS